MRSHKPLSLFKIWDIVLVVILLVLVGMTLYFTLSHETGEYAEIFVEGKLYQKVALAEDTIIDLDHLKVVVKGGEVRVEDADCPDKICERRGAIARSGESIVCLPNRVVVKVTGKSEVEAIT